MVDKVHQQEVDIAIVGGGMVGASLALLLSAQQPQWRILVIEAFPMAEAGAPSAPYQPSFDARSTALSHSSRKIFETIGLWSTLQTHLAEISQVHVSDRGHVGNTLLSASEQKVPALGYVVENQWLGSVLMAALQHAPGVEIVAPARLETVRPAKSGVSLTLEKVSANYHAKLLVVADGAQSTTRKKLGIEARIQDYGQVALIANISLEKDHNGVAYERFTDQGPMALLPLEPVAGKHRSALVWTLPPDQAESLADCSEAEFLAALQERFGYRLGRFVRVGSRHAYPLKLITASEQVRRHLVLVGNAAHSLHPVAGQGFNLALRGVAMLADVLARNSSKLGDLAVLQDYLARQQLDQQQTVLLSDLLPRVFGFNALPVAAVRNAGLLALDIVPGIRNQFSRLGMGLETRGAILNSGKGQC